MMWIQVLEKGNGYTVYRVKGMELQETSCHNLEATKADPVSTWLPIFLMCHFLNRKSVTSMNKTCMVLHIG